MRFPKRKTIWSLLLLTALVASSIALFAFRPQPNVFVEFAHRNTILVNDVPVDSTNLLTRIESEKTWRSFWLQKSDVIVLLPSSMANKHYGDDLLSTGIDTISLDQLQENRSGESMVRVSIHARDIFELLNEHGLDELDNVAIGGVSRPNAGNQHIAR